MEDYVSQLVAKEIKLRLGDSNDTKRRKHDENETELSKQRNHCSKS